MKPTLIEKYSRPVPRYTSFPTAPHFHDGITEETYRGWLGQLNPQDPLSLYVHIPYCDTLCWFCGCHTKMTKSYSPIENYLNPLTKEISAVGAAIPAGRKLKHIHWGGGSPTILKPDHIRSLAARIKDVFETDEQTEFAVEIDPRGLGQDTLDALAEAGVTRASLGVQDFDPDVQKAINRIQTYEETAQVIDGLRNLGVTSINIDVLYGLPHQTCGTMESTIKKVLSLEPDRIALFGYAHVPWMKRHQAMINEAALPTSFKRFAQADLAANILECAGYIRVGFDHFAKPEDPLAKAVTTNALKRNFQGYTTDSASTLIGLGASAISSLPQGYVQNVAPMGDYERRINETGFATSKGFAFAPEDHLRAHVIERLMCDMSFSISDISKKFGNAAEPVLQEADDLIWEHQDELVTPTEDGFKITEQGRPFMRTICAHFDPYLKKNIARHSAAV